MPRKIARDLSYLIGMSRLMTADEDYPLIQINQTKRRMLILYFAQGETVTGENIVVRRFARFVVGGE